MHIMDKQRAINKAANLLNNGGRFILSIDKNQSDVIDMGSRRMKIYPDNSDEIVKMLQIVGLKIAEQYETEFAHVFVATRRQS